MDADTRQAIRALDRRVTQLAKRIHALEQVNEQEALRRKVYLGWGQRLYVGAGFLLVVAATLSQVFNYHL